MSAWQFTTDGTPSIDPNYKCIITCNDKNINIVASLPQSFSLDANAAYEEPYAQTLNNLGGSGLSAWTKPFGMQLATQALSVQVWQGTSEMSFSLPLVFQVENSGADVISPLSQLYRLILPEERTDNGLLQSPGPYVDAKRFLAQISSDESKSKLSESKNGLISTAKQTVDSAANGNIYDAGSTAVSGGVKSSSQALGVISKAIKASLVNRVSLSVGKYMNFPDVVVTSVSQTAHTRPLDTGEFSQIEVTVGFKTLYTPTQSDIQGMFVGRESAAAPQVSSATKPQAGSGSQ